MSYTINMPLANQSLGVTQPLVNRNFTIIDTTLNVDHYSVTDTTANQGRHKRVSLVNQATAPTTGAGRLALYSADVAGRSTLFYKKDGSVTEIQLTGINPVAAAPGYTFLPGQMLMQWNKNVAIPSSGETITFPITFTDLYSLVVSIVDPSNTVRIAMVVVQDNADFQVVVKNESASLRSSVINWTAIGRYTG